MDMSIGVGGTDVPLLPAGSGSEYGSGDGAPPSPGRLHATGGAAAPAPINNPPAATCTQRVTQYLTPYRTLIVLYGSAFVAGVGAGMAKREVVNGSYSGTEFVTGTALMAASVTGSAVAVACGRNRTPNPSAGFGVGHPPLRVIGHSSMMCMLGVLGYTLGTCIHGGMHNNSCE